MEQVSTIKPAAAIWRWRVRLFPQVTLTGCILPAGGFQVTCNSSPYQTCLIQTTTDLGSPNWVTIGTNTADVNGLITFVDSVAKDYPARFYRTVAF